MVLDGDKMFCCSNQGGVGGHKCWLGQLHWHADTVTTECQQQHSLSRLQERGGAVPAAPPCNDLHANPVVDLYTLLAAALQGKAKESSSPSRPILAGLPKATGTHRRFNDACNSP